MPSPNRIKRPLFLLVTSTVSLSLTPSLSPHKAPLYKLHFMHMTILTRDRDEKKAELKRERHTQRVCCACAKMNTLDSPLDALAVNYLSFGFSTAVNSVWTWVAVITAAVSFWRIKAAGAAGTLKFLPRGQNPDESPPPAPSSSAENSVDPEPASTSDSLSAPSVKSVETAEGTTRGKFTVYYKDEREGELAAAGDEDDGGVDGLGGEGSGGGGERRCGSWEWDWETALRMRTGDGDKGWYRNQDLTVLDGNVVRLWDGCRQRSKASISFSSTVTGRVMW